MECEFKSYPARKFALYKMDDKLGKRNGILTYKFDIKLRNKFKWLT